MKNKLFLSSILFSLTILPLVSGAQEATVNADANVRIENREARDEKKDTIRQNLDNKREALKSAVDERRENANAKIKERIGSVLENVKERFEAAVERLEKLADRIDSRIQKLEAENVDVTESKELFVEAQTKIEIAKQNVAEISITASTSATTTESIKEDFEAIRAKIEIAKSSIQEAHRALVEVVNNLKPGQAKLDSKIDARVKADATSATSN